MYILGAFYIAYLGYELHRSLCIDRNNFSMSGRFAKIAQWLTPWLRVLPDVAALMKYALVAITIGVTLTQQNVVRCRDFMYEAKLVQEVSGDLIYQGCHPSAESVLSSRRDLIMTIFGIQGLLYATSIKIKQRMLWPARAGQIVTVFVASQLLMLGVQLFCIGELASLRRMDDLPNFHCAGDTINSSSMKSGLNSSYTLAHVDKTTSAAAAAWLASGLRACPTLPTPPPTLPIPPSPTPPSPPTSPTPAPSCSNECCKSDCKHVWPNCIDCCKAYINITSACDSCTRGRQCKLPTPTPVPIPTPTSPTPMPTPVVPAPRSYTCFNSGATGIRLNVTLIKSAEL
jgi:hypothetical protein